MMYSGSGSSSEISEFRIHAKVPDPCGSGSNPYFLCLFGNCKQNHLKVNHKEESINYLPFSISYYCSTVHNVQNSQRNNFFIYLLFHILLDPDPGKSSGSVLDPYPYWIHIQELPGSESGSVFGIRIWIHIC